MARQTQAEHFLFSGLDAVVTQQEGGAARSTGAWLTLTGPSGRCCGRWIGGQFSEKAADDRVEGNEQNEGCETATSPRRGILQTKHHSSKERPGDGNPVPENDGTGKWNNSCDSPRAMELRNEDKQRSQYDGTERESPASIPPVNHAPTCNERHRRQRSQHEGCNYQIPHVRHLNSQKPAPPPSPT